MEEIVKFTVTKTETINNKDASYDTIREELEKAFLENNGDESIYLDRGAERLKHSSKLEDEILAKFKERRKDMFVDCIIDSIKLSYDPYSLGGSSEPEYKGDITYTISSGKYKVMSVDTNNATLLNLRTNIIETISRVGLQMKVQSDQ